MNIEMFYESVLNTKKEDWIFLRNLNQYRLKANVLIGLRFSDAVEVVDQNGNIPSEIGAIGDDLEKTKNNTVPNGSISYYKKYVYLTFNNLEVEEFLGFNINSNHFNLFAPVVNNRQFITPQENLLIELLNEDQQADFVYEKLQLS